MYVIMYFYALHLSFVRELKLKTRKYWPQLPIFLLTYMEYVLGKKIVFNTALLHVGSFWFAFINEPRKNSLLLIHKIFPHSQQIGILMVSQNTTWHFQK